MTRLTLWIPAATMLLVSLISYIDRNTLALLAPTILKETGLSAEQYGYVISAFSIAYMLANPLWGRWLDRFGVRLGMIAAVTVWSVASASHALAAGFVGFAAARATLGFGEGATFPGGLRVVMQTLPARLRARGVAVAYSGGSLGSVITPIVITPIALAWGWRAAFLFTGAVGAAWLAIWLVVSSRAEIRRRHASGPAPAGAARPRFRDPRLWSYMIAYALGALPLALVIYAAALYLNRVLGASQALIGSVLWIPPVGWEAGYFFWGWLSDRLPDSGHGKVTGLGRLLAVTAAFSLPLALVPRHASFALAMFQMFVAMFLAGGFIILTVSYATHVYSPDHAGLLAGLGAGAWSAAVAVVMPVFGRLIDRSRWDAAFLLAAALPAAGYLIWLALNGRKPRPPDPSQSPLSCV
ncbi:MAG: MFS transporter [Bryobacteraceae bacterium]